MTYLHHKNLPGFEDIADDPTRVKCIPCSAAFHMEKLLAKKSISSHRKVPRHIQAVAQADGMTDASSSAPPDGLLPAATETGVTHLLDLSVADEFLASDSEDEGMYDAPPGVSNPFDDSAVYDAGHEVYNTAGRPVWFDAGSVPLDRTREHIARELETLVYSDAPRLGSFASKAGDIPMHDLDEDSGDSTVTGVVAALRVMGKLISVMQMLMMLNV